MIRIALCEDEFRQRNMLKNILLKELEKSNLAAKIIEFESGEQLVGSMKDNTCNFDIIFLDIKMNGISGVDAARKIRETNKSTIIIFVTGLMEYVFEGYSVRAFNYILKPLKEEKITRVFKEALDSLEMIKNEVYLVSLKDKSLKIRFEDILYFCSDKRLVTLVSKQKSYHFYSKLDHIEKELCDRNFLRCHQRYLINMSNISSIEPSTAITTLGDSIPISRNRYKKTLIAFAKQKIR